jgi:hypothetical protein
MNRDVVDFKDFKSFKPVLYETESGHSSRKVDAGRE